MSENPEQIRARIDATRADLSANVDAVATRWTRARWRTARRTRSAAGSVRCATA